MTKIQQLETRIAKLEASFRAQGNALRGFHKELWLVETRKTSSGSYPTDPTENVFRAIPIERVFSNAEGTQTLTDGYLADEDQEDSVPEWFYVQTPWYVPRGFRFHAWFDRTVQRAFAINPPRSLLVSVSSVPAATGTHPDIVLGQATAAARKPVYSSSWTTEIVQSGGDDVELPIFNISRTGITENHLLGASVREHPDFNCGIWVVDIDPCT